MIYYGYVRVSTDDQQENGASIDAQMEAISSALAYRKLSEPVMWLVETGTGKHMKRPKLNELLGEIADGDVLVIAKLDRLTRSVIDLGKLLELAKQGGWTIWALDFGLDMATPQGELVANVLMSVAQWERRIIGERTREALAEKRRQGIHTGRPFTIATALQDRIRFLRNEEKRTFREICEILNEEGVPTPRGGVEWRPSSIESVLKK